MGSVLSRVRLTLRIIRTISDAYKVLARKLSLSPGIPISNPSIPYWSVPPSPIANHSADEVLLQPAYADVVIIGSGITGTAFARTLLDHIAQHPERRMLKVVMLEARDACSGATARNGGHITPPLYHDYVSLKNAYGPSMARKIICFRLGHLSEYLRVANEENLVQESQCREVQSYDVFFDYDAFSQSMKKVAVYKQDFPVEGRNVNVVDTDEGIAELQLCFKVVGCITTRAGVVHPYRLVTGILSRLLRDYSDNFHLFTHTPCTDISAPSPDTGLYILSTPKGTIETPHVVHATNAWASHLLPPMRGKIVPLRGTMTAQRPGMGLGKSNPETVDSSWFGTRSFVFYPSSSLAAYDYLTQQPLPYSTLAGALHSQTRVSPSQSASTIFDADTDMGAAFEPDSIYPPPAAEFMFGGGMGHSERGFLEEVGNVDDSRWELSKGSYLGGALSNYFSNWGEEGRGDNLDQKVTAEWGQGRVKALWSGILGVSADGLPWVGRLPEKITGRLNPVGKSHHSKKAEAVPPGLAPSGEWIAAGYSGEGMVHAWLSGKALACMVLGEDHCLPEPYLVSTRRWKNANVENLLSDILN